MARYLVAVLLCAATLSATAAEPKVLLTGVSRVTPAVLHSDHHGTISVCNASFVPDAANFAACILGFIEDASSCTEYDSDVTGFYVADKNGDVCGNEDGETACDDDDLAYTMTAAADTPMSGDHLYAVTNAFSKMSTDKDLGSLDTYCDAVRLAQQVGLYRVADTDTYGTNPERMFECEDLDGEVIQWLLPAIIGVFAALFMVAYFTKFVMDTPPGTEEDVQLRKIAEYVHEGAVTFLLQEYKWLVVFVVMLVICMAVLFGILDSQDDLGALYVCICIVVGSTFSASAGFLGMHIATKANIRTAHACRTGLGTGLSVAFKSGAVMGLTVTGLGLTGLIIFTAAFKSLDAEWNYIAGFGMGGSAIALFARVGGGIYTKAADVGADLVGKVENNIPEDDARNPAVIADNVGDNVGDVAGMGADLFESYAGSIIAACTLAHHNLVVNMTVFDYAFSQTDFVKNCANDDHILGADVNGGTAFFVEEVNAYQMCNAQDGCGLLDDDGNELIGKYVEKKIPYLEMDLAYSAMALPFWVAGVGILCSIIGIFVVQTDDKAGPTVEEDDSGLSDAEKKEKQEKKREEDIALLEKLLWITRYGVAAAAFFVLAASALCCWMLFGESAFTWRIWACICIGLCSGEIIGVFTEYCTSYTYMPTMSIAQMSDTGPATVIIQGMGVGMISCVVPTVTLLVCVIWTNAWGGVYGVAIAAVGMLSTLGVTLATDAYGPVADNAGGLAEMCNCEEIVRERTDALDALGNTTAATGKGFAIGSAVLTSVGLVAAYMEETGLQAGDVDLQKADVLVGILFGAMLPFLFGALTMLSVGRAAEQIILQVRKQFYEVLVDLDAGVYKDEQGGIMTWDEWDPKFLPQKEGNDESSVNQYYNKCIEISTTSSLKEMLIPGIMAVLSPAIIGFVLGAPALAGLLAGALTSGFMLAITMANAGGAWDNAKKYCEKGGLGEGKGKNTENHSACVVGDTVGDPFKDTSGPALNILIKLMSIVSLVLAPVFKNCCQQSFSVEGTIAGLVLLVVSTIICICLQMKMNKDNAAWREEIEAQAKAVKSKGDAASKARDMAAEAKQAVPASNVVPVMTTPPKVDATSAAAPTEAAPPAAAPAEAAPAEAAAPAVDERV